MKGKQKSKFQQLRKMLDDSAALVERLEESAATMEEVIKSLENQGITNATPYWMAGEYLYLNHPTDAKGKRVRKYVGKDPAKVEQALESIKRYEQHRQLTAECSTIKNTAERARYDLERVYCVLQQSATAAKRAIPLELDEVSKAGAMAQAQTNTGKARHHG